MNQDLAPLIARLEAAEGPSRELDGDIAEALGLHKGRRIGRSMFALSPAHAWMAPKFTGSADKALTLVPPECRVRELGQWWDVSRPGGWYCTVMRWEYDQQQHLVEQPYVYGYADDDVTMPKTAPNAALALCIAALRARQSGEG